MHAKPLSRASAFINAAGPYDLLHVEHHNETNFDMSINDYSVSRLEADPTHELWHDRERRFLAGIYFSIKTSLYSSLIGMALITAQIALFRLAIPLYLVPPACALTAVYHQMFWNKIHADSHFVTARRPDALPYCGLIPTENAAGDWILRNHIGHHAVKGRANWNIVFPGMDFVFGTHVWKKAEDPNDFNPFYVTRDSTSVAALVRPPWIRSASERRRAVSAAAASQ